MHRMTPLIGLGFIVMLTGCNGIDAPLVFGKVDTLGISGSATAPDQGGNLTLGYRSAKVAVVPVTARDANGRPIVLEEHRGGPANSGAFSTFAQFEASAAALKACLGDTFATGLAAQVVASKIDRVCK